MSIALRLRPNASACEAGSGAQWPSLVSLRSRTCSLSRCCFTSFFHFRIREYSPPLARLSDWSEWSFAVTPCHSSGLLRSRQLLLSLRLSSCMSSKNDSVCGRSLHLRLCLAGLFKNLNILSGRSSDRKVLAIRSQSFRCKPNLFRNFAFILVVLNNLPV